MTNPSLLQLPPGVQLVYLAEGGANVIYRFVSNPPQSAKKDLKAPQPSTIHQESPDGGVVPAILKGKLLRLRKETASNVCYKDTLKNFNIIIRPLFRPDELVDQSLIRLPEGLVQHCNEGLRNSELNGLRPKKRHGGYLCLDEPFGLLITDMTVFDDPGATLAELKPKWLYQSPSAPVGSIRCRTCALREMKNFDMQKIAKKEQKSFCPIDLVSEQFENVLRATAFIKVAPNNDNDDDHDRMRLARILFQNPTLQSLQSKQKSFREVGLSGPSILSRENSLDMTLRDCTMFIKIPRDESSPVEIRLGDLDLKTGAGGKAQYWRDLEHQLIDGGWYTGSNSCQQPSECALQIDRKSVNFNGNGNNNSNDSGNGEGVYSA